MISRKAVIVGGALALAGLGAFLFLGPSGFDNDDPSLKYFALFDPVRGSYIDGEVSVSLPSSEVSVDMFVGVIENWCMSLYVGEDVDAVKSVAVLNRNDSQGWVFRNEPGRCLAWGEAMSSEGTSMITSHAVAHD